MKNVKNRKIFRNSCLALLLMSFSFVMTAEASLNATGPIDLSNGFPQFYRDDNGLAMQQCLADATGFADPFCFPPGLFLTFNKTQKIVFPANYPTEVFYWMIQARALNVGQHGLGRATLGISLESSFASLNPKGAVQPGQQVTFLRINLGKLTDLVPGATYKITHPFGTFNITADPAGSVSRTRFEDGCFGSPCDFSLLLPATTTNIGPFLTWTGVPPGLPLNLADPGASYIGDGITLHTISPGPYGAIFRIDGPGIGGVLNGNPVDFVETDLWTVQGKMIISGATLVVDGSSSSANTTSVNSPATYLVTVTNTGNAQDTFDLAVRASPASVAFMNMSQIVLDPGASGTVLLNVMSAAPGSYIVNVTAASAANPEVDATIITVTTVGGINPSIAMLKPTENLTFTDTQGSVIWSSSNTTVGDIDPESGVFIAKLEGVTIITATGETGDTAVVIVGTNRYTSQPLVTGFNSVIVPVRPDIVFTASKLLQLVTAQNGDAAGLSVSKWNATTQAFDTFDPAAGLNDFPILAEDGYLVQVSGIATKISIVGTLAGIS